MTTAREQGRKLRLTVFLIKDGTDSLCQNRSSPPLVREDCLVEREIPRLTSRLSGGVVSAVRCNRLIENVTSRLWSRRGVSPGRQVRQVDLWFLPSQRLKKGDDGVLFLVGELLPELHLAHDAHSLLEAPNLTGMKIWGPQRDVAKRPGAKYIFVAGRLGNGEAALVVGRQNVGAGFLDHSEGKVRLSTDVDAVVAGRTALVHEH